MSQLKTIFAVSDIHGHYSLLKAALDEAGFDPHNPEHLLICCGDYFNRGTENQKVLEFFESIKRKVLIRGNQDDVLLEIFATGEFQDYYYQNGIFQSIDEWFGRDILDPVHNRLDFSGHEATVARIKAFLEPTIPYFETRHFVFTHCWLPNDWDADSCRIRPNWREADFDTWHKARLTKWTSVYHISDRLPDKTIVCGHVPTFFGMKVDPTRGPDDASVFYGDGVTVLDAGTYDSGQVNVLKIKDELL